ncbi:hypothetical protein KDW40_02285 [Burkholderia cenocepacia]|uniref:hypothetical protein n=1 Tax=Burkholderia cenocepacia TaxID=95486 RepID=UPI001B91DECA|nr:hypothetical protein [Burkholderia cenocepacia]MBR8043394.1 hypothetical protein [Burkholderia cenocepacia]MBR8324559.1 hypothetical protein [Burkholderia cenocepacia]
METIHLKAIVFDHTRYWADDIVARGERIYQTYLFDASRTVHCCEITPSYELHPLYATPLVYDEDGELSEEILMHQEHEIKYYHMHAINRTEPRFIVCGPSATPLNSGDGACDMWWERGSA